MKCKICLDTMNDVNQFVKAVSYVDCCVELADEEGHCVNAKSVLGALYSMEWSNIYCKCDKDISGLILKWII